MRYQDWPERLAKIVKESHSKPFMWGTHDCCLFAANVVLELTGVDHAADLRETYSTTLEAARVLKDRHGVRGIASAALGKEIAPLTAKRGDIVLIQTKEHGDTLAVCIGEYCVVPGLESLQRISMMKAIAAWSVN